MSSVVENIVLIVESSSFDVYFNLALEEHLLDRVGEFERILYLYRDSAAVVIGKNQNPWRECDVSALARDGVALARRISGGGTVWHDEGNLNFSLMMPRAAYKLDRQFEWLIQVLRGLGVESLRSGNNSLVCHGMKFSGNAFCLRREAAMHHGTLLVAADLARLTRYLAPALPGVETKAIASVPAVVGNLGEMAPGLTIEAVAAGLAAACGPAERRTERDFAGSGFSDYLMRQRDWDWIFGHTPRFEADLKPGLRVAVERGRIIAATGADEFIGEKFDVACQ